MAKNAIIEAAEEARTAAREGVKVVRSMLGRTTDPDLELYEQLAPEDFQEMAREYGLEQVGRYVKHMEFRRLKGGR